MCAAFFFFLNGASTQMSLCAQQDSKNMESAGFQEERSAGILEGKLTARYL